MRRNVRRSNGGNRGKRSGYDGRNEAAAKGAPTAAKGAERESEAGAEGPPPASPPFSVLRMLRRGRSRAESHPPVALRERRDAGRRRRHPSRQSPKIRVHVRALRLLVLLPSPTASPPSPTRWRGCRLLTATPTPRSSKAASPAMVSTDLCMGKRARAAARVAPPPTPRAASRAAANVPGRSGARYSTIWLTDSTRTWRTSFICGRPLRWNRRGQWKLRLMWRLWKRRRLMTRRLRWSGRWS